MPVNMPDKISDIILNRMLNKKINRMSNKKVKNISARMQ